VIARTGTGWQYALADLSLILFMVTAAALSQANAKGAAAQPSARGETLALWRAEPDGPPLKTWLEAQAPDPRQQLTIVARYEAGGQGSALQEARELASSAGEAGRSARIVIEPGEGGFTAALAYDAPAVLARSLQEHAPTQP
jgi:hypothetical protein